MPVLATTIWKINPGKMQEFLANVTAAKKIIERHGGRVRLLAQRTGTNAPCHITVIESADWKAFGELQTRLDGDSEWQAFFQKILATKEPAADAIGTGLSVEVPVG
jgi:hypothetical protein